MTDDTFDDIVTLAGDSTGLIAAVREASAELLRETPSGVDVVAIGHRAWRQLTPVQQARALDLLFHAFVLQLAEEDRATRVAQGAASVTTYLSGEEEVELHRALGEARPIDDDTSVMVNAVDLSNVLDELALVRHRLAMAKDS
ncbi:hypothetical protein [Actinacidiphila sp. ITFR-21]|uniref:hypothetical protein n=1 Tax=Actinacidiphila sp. ITFR-21 TaxID=3075199 RepID=UPI00288C1F07|nr:hypothetical protein [Streptomyces sp. ITFR-21]WNI16942.1 hypothetical protein RLT57_16360 [Streptomyces sp. ITFR-21]